MTAEAPIPVDLKPLSVKDLSRQSLKEISAFGNEIKSAESPVERAVANVAVINKLRELPAVQAYLKTTGIYVGIVRSGFLGETRLDVSSRGIELRWYDGSKNDGSGFANAPFRTTREDLVRYYERMLFPPNMKSIVRKFARLKPEQIVKKFEEAVSAAIKVK